MRGGANVSELLLDAAARWPHRQALVDLGEPDGVPLARTWGELAAGARGVARALRARGFGPGDVVGVLGRNDARYVERWFGVALAGCTLAPLPALSAPDEIAWRAAHAEVRLIVHDDATAGLMAEAHSRFVEHGAAAMVWSEAELLAAVANARGGQRSARAPGGTGGSDAALLLYTSGTTGHAKGACISHGTLLAHTRNLAGAALDLGPTDTVLAALPFSHSFGCRMVMLACAHTGARMLIFRRFSAPQVWRALADYGVTWLPVVPTMLAALVREATAQHGRSDHQPPEPGTEPGTGRRAPAPLPALRWCLSAGATLPEPIREAASVALGAPVYQGYGLTEATFSAMDHPPAPPTPGCVGRPSPGVTIRVVDDDGRDLPAGATGEVVIRGDNTFLGYLRDPAATAQVVVDGWLHTGDLGTLDADGRLAIVGRRKDLIVRGGYNVYPAEVETALASHPAVAQVAVVGVSDAYLGQEVVALLVAPPSAARPSLSELDAWARTRLARYKVPRRYGWVTQLPLGPSRKVLKRTLRRQLADGSLLTEAVEKTARPATKA